MGLLIMLAALLVIAAVSTAILTASHLDVLRRRVSRLEQARDGARLRLLEAEQQREALEGSRNLLEKLKLEKLEKRKELRQELEALEKEAAPEHEISLGPQYERRSLDLEE